MVKRDFGEGFHLTDPPPVSFAAECLLPDGEAPFTSGWDEAVRYCRACHLGSEGGKGGTGYTGTVPSPLMIVGEGPGSVEDQYGVPLVGPSGRLLDKALASVGISRDRIYVTNIVKCRPRGNRTPTPEEGAYCARRWLVREIRLVQPAVIVALGKVALAFFSGRVQGIVRQRGKWFWFRPDTQAQISYPVMPTFHPAYLLRLTGKDEVRAKWQVYYDLLAAKEKATESAPEYRWQTLPVPDTRAPYEMRKRQRLGLE